jgi:hypothetical protein
MHEATIAVAGVARRESLLANLQSHEPFPSLILQNLFGSSYDWAAIATVRRWHSGCSPGSHHDAHADRLL